MTWRRGFLWIIPWADPGAGGRGALGCVAGLLAALFKDGSALDRTGDLPDRAPPKLHSTNPLERLHGEIKRRTNTVGIFPNEDAITRLIGAILLEQNDEWGRPESQIHDTGIHRSRERQYYRQAARRGSLSLPAPPAGYWLWAAPGSCTTPWDMIVSAELWALVRALPVPIPETAALDQRRRSLYDQNGPARKCCRCASSWPKIKRLRGLRPGPRSNVGLGGCGPPQPKNPR